MTTNPNIFTEAESLAQAISTSLNAGELEATRKEARQFLGGLAKSYARREDIARILRAASAEGEARVARFEGYRRAWGYSA